MKTTLQNRGISFISLNCTNSSEKRICNYNPNCNDMVTSKTTKNNDLEDEPSTVHIFTTDLQKTEFFEEKYGTKKSEIARLGLRMLNRILLPLIPKDLNLDHVELKKEQCSVRYSKQEIIDANNIEKAIGCKFSDLSRCGYHLGIMYLEFETMEKNHESEFDRSLEHVFELYSRELQQK